MTKLVEGPVKFILSNIAVILAIMLLPIFLVTNSVSFFDSIINYLFNN
ncbi:hypothetical protein SAMN05216238_10328 [Lentibacillus persicus]|uniref:Uncharacterized protein n=1 Tax=Lentibacillus persicus TaxID=640948 RepID=A0A1I1U5F8_9BACI|nr:hypothetical protein [Lentibacillus persicus]SFD65924.1 hypothetical protein SAMN05216238_10328 [Lentibacillus persicus]